MIFTIWGKQYNTEGMSRQGRLVLKGQVRAYVDKLIELQGKCMCEEPIDLDKAELIGQQYEKLNKIIDELSK